MFSNGRLNLFQRCIIPIENEDFDIYEKSLLYSIFKYCTKYQIKSVTPELKQFVRVIRNLLLNTSQFTQAQVNIISNLRITEYESYNKVIDSIIEHPVVADTLISSITGLGGKNAISIEKEKLSLSNREIVCWLEDMSFCQGNINAFEEIMNYPSDKLIKGVIQFNNASDADRVRLLIASGYYGMGIGWCSYGYRYFFGKEGRWNVVFNRDSKNIGKALKTFIDADCSIEDYITHNIPTEHNFQYYALKYDEFVRSAGYWQKRDDPNSCYYFAINGTLEDLDLISLKSFSKSPLLAYHTEPFASVVLWKLRDYDSQTFGDNKLRNANIYAEKASLVYAPKDEKVALSLRLTNKKWQISEIGPSLPSELQKKYNIEGNTFDGGKEMDLITVAVNFIVSHQ